MAGTEDRELYDVMMAARRVKRDRVTIYLWMRQGMPFRMIGTHRYIEHEVLLSWYRAKLVAVRENRGRRQAGRWVAAA
jgi:predicted pyridoxine 5'-phosphate oxidase superfamily flavin-nucleotide-binding protein